MTSSASTLLRPPRRQPADDDALDEVWGVPATGARAWPEDVLDLIARSTGGDIPEKLVDAGVMSKVSIVLASINATTA